MFDQLKIAAFALAASCFAASGASATAVWPGSIVGAWTGLSNQTQIILRVTTQTAGGKCESISGTIENVAAREMNNMVGYYCPGSGAVEFLRLPTNSNVAYQAYTANLSQNDAPKDVGGMFMGGTFSQYSPAYGPLGQYSWSVSKFKSSLTQ